MPFGLAAVGRPKFPFPLLLVLTYKYIINAQWKMELPRMSRRLGEAPTAR